MDEILMDGNKLKREARLLLSGWTTFLLLDEKRRTWLLRKVLVRERVIHADGAMENPLCHTSSV